MDEPPVWPDGSDHEREAVYAAEEGWAEKTCGVDRADEHLLEAVPADEVVAYLVRAAVAGGFTTVPDDPPTVAFDIEDGSELAGRANAHAIHLHPKLLQPWILLHELAHWIDNRDGHGPIFQANMVALVDGALGRAAATELTYAYAEEGLTPDQWRLPAGIQGSAYDEPI